MRSFQSKWALRKEIEKKGKKTELIEAKEDIQNSTVLREWMSDFGGHDRMALSDYISVIIVDLVRSNPRATLITNNLHIIKGN